MYRNKLTITMKIPALTEITSGTSETIMDVVDDDDWIRTVARIPIMIPATGFV